MTTFSRTALARSLGGLLLLALAAGPLAAQDKTTLKLATLVPDGSVWHKALKDLGADVAKTTGGRVALTIFPGGVAGDEADMVRKMRIGQLQAATLTISGLAQLDEGFRVLQLPMFFNDYGELNATLEALKPTFRERLEKKGFVLLHWGHAGWVQLFSTKPVRTPADLKALKLFVWAGDDRMVQWWKSGGFQPVALASTDILTGLNTGMVQALGTTPLAALSLQWFRATPYMMDLGFGPLVGGTVVTKKAWDKLSPADQKAVLEASARAEAALAKEVPEGDRKAIEEMKKRGLQVIATTDVAGWRKEAESMTASTRGGAVDAAVLAQATKARDAARAAAKAGAKP